MHSYYIIFVIKMLINSALKVHCDCLCYIIMLFHIMLAVLFQKQELNLPSSQCVVASSPLDGVSFVCWIQQKPFLQKNNLIVLRLYRDIDVNSSYFFPNYRKIVKSNVSDSELAGCCLYEETLLWSFFKFNFQCFENHQQNFALCHCVLAQNCKHQI